jgi:hypothetical protein
MFYGQNILARASAFLVNLISFLGDATAKIVGIW